MSTTPPTPIADTPKPKRGGFFIVDRGMFHRACALGMRPAVALLILARFTQGRSNRSRASSNAIEKRTGIARKPAREAIAALETAGIVTRTGTPTRPVHHITRHEDTPDPRGPITDAQREAFKRAQDNDRAAAKNPLKVSARGKVDRSDAVHIATLERAKYIKRVGNRWEAIDREPGEAVYLPNELVDGIDGAPSPVDLIRQTGDAMTLRLLVDLYTAHRLSDWHGIDPRIASQKHKEVYRRRVDAVLLLGWDASGVDDAHWGNTITDPHKVDAGATLYQRLRMIQQLGLLVFVPHVVDGDGAPVYPVPPAHLSGTHPLEVEMGTLARAAVCTILEAHLDDDDDDDDDPDAYFPPPGTIIAVVPRHMERASLVGIARLTYRPHTGMTTAWAAELTEMHAGWSARFATAGFATAGIAKARGA